MSNVSNRHTVNLFRAGKSEPLSGQRLAKIGYKQTKEMTKNGEKALPSICVSVPPVDQTQIQGAILEGLMPHIVSLVESAQDDIIRAANDASGGTLQVVTDEQISLEACISFLAAQSAGERISNESIAAWFSREVEDNLTVVFAEKLGFSEITEDVQKTLDKHTAQYLGICQMLAGKGLTKHSLSDARRRAIKVCLKIASDDSGMTTKLKNKLEELEKMPEPSEMLELDLED